MRCIALSRPEKGRGITFFHAFSGSDVVSAVRCKGKKYAWQTWDMCAEASDVFASLSQYQQVATVNDNEVDILEKCVVMMYDKCSTATRVNNARLDRLLGSRDHTKPFHQLDQLYFSISSVIPTRQAVFGANQHCASQKHRALLTGDGRRMEIRGM